MPPIPDLATWPGDYAARVRAASGAALRLQQPVQALGELAHLYHANGLYHEAQQVELGLQALRPTDPQWIYLLADTYQNLGDPDAQQAYLEMMLRLVPYYPVTRLKLAELLFKQGRIDEAYAHYEWRLTLVPGDPYALLGLARIAQQRGNLREAARNLEAIVSRDPGFSAAHNQLASIYDRLGEPARADKERSLGASTGRFVEANDPRLYRVYAWAFNPDIVYLYGQTAMQPVQWEKSLAFYQQVVRLAPGDPSGYEALGGIEARLNRAAEARATLERGLAVARGIGDAAGAERLAQALQKLAH